MEVAEEELKLRAGMKRISRTTAMLGNVANVNACMGWFEGGAFERNLCGMAVSLRWKQRDRYVPDVKHSLRMDALSGCKSGLALGRFTCPFWSILDEIAFLKLCNEWDLANQSITHTTLASMRILDRFLYRCKRFFLDRAYTGPAQRALFRVISVHIVPIDGR